MRRYQGCLSDSLAFAVSIGVLASCVGTVSSESTPRSDVADAAAMRGGGAITGDGAATTGSGTDAVMGTETGSLPFGVDGSADSSSDIPGPGACGTVSPPPGPPGPEPPVNPTPISGLNPGAITKVPDGVFGNYVTEVSAGAGMAAGTATMASRKITIWAWKEPGAFLEYTVDVTKRATYALNFLYRAAEIGGAADFLIGGTNVGTIVFDHATGSDFGWSHSVLVKLDPGTSKMRIVFTPRSAPVDIVEMRASYPGPVVLPRAGVVHPLSGSTTTIPVDEPSDFYRVSYDGPKKQWACHFSFCEVEYFVETQRAGAYEITMNYSNYLSCNAVKFLVNGVEQAGLKLAQGGTQTPPKKLQLPCGVSRLNIHNPNYFDGEFCGGGGYGEVTLKPLP